MLALRGLGRDYGDRVAVAALDLDVARGECLGLLGANGAGKTTTISMICGVVTPTRGTITIDGADVRTDPYVAKRRLGVVPQELALYDELDAVANLRYFGALYRIARDKLASSIERVLELVGLTKRAKDRVGAYSGGMKRRLNLAAGLLHEPALLVLDEPTVGVDPQSRNHIFETVRALTKAGTTVVYTSHYLEEVEAMCDRVAILDEGKLLACSTVRELVAQHAGSGVHVELAGESAAIDAAIEAARAHATVVRVEVAGASLENAFLALTGHALRDDE